MEGREKDMAEKDEMMKAAVFMGPERIEVKEAPKP